MGGEASAAQHGLALMRYGLLGDSSGLHHIWSMSNAAEMATLSLTVVSIRVFTRAAVR